MPERTISARYAASKTTKAVSATVYSGSAVPMSAGIMNQNQKITITSGTPRKNSTYTPAASASQRARASRARAIAVPRMNPRAIAGSARRKVPPAKPPTQMKPWSIRKEKLSAMTSKSISGLADVSARDHSRYRGAPLEARAERRERQAEKQVKHRAGDQCFEGLGGVGFDLAHLKGQLGDADGERDRGILEQVERLVGRGRDDQPERHRQNDQAIGLRG